MLRAVSRVVLISLDGLASFYWTDPGVRMPTLRRLAERGVVARRMECVCPSTTWPTHASMVTGVRPDRHGVVANYILNRESGRAEDLTGDPIYDADRLLRATTVYDIAHAAGRRTVAVDWPCTRRAASLDFNLPFFKDQRVFESATHPDVWRELGALGLPIDRLGEWSQLPKRFLRADVVADAAAHVLRRHAPDLMPVHVLCADRFPHPHAPRSPESDYAGLGLPVPDDNPMMGDLVLEAATGYAFGDDARGDDHLGAPRYRGNHGHRPDHPDIGAFFLAAGVGVRRCAELGTIMSRDV